LRAIAWWPGGVGGGDGAGAGGNSCCASNAQRNTNAKLAVF